MTQRASSRHVNVPTNSVCTIDKLSHKSACQSAASRKQKGKANVEMMEQNSSKKKPCADKAMPNKTCTDRQTE